MFSDVQSYNLSQVHQWLRSTHLVNTNTHSLNGLSEAHFLNPLTEIQFAMTRFLHGQEIRPGKPLPTPRNFLLKAIYCALHHIIFSLIAFYYFFGPSVAFLSSLLGHTAQQTSLAPEQLFLTKKKLKLRFEMAGYSTKPCKEMFVILLRDKKARVSQGQNPRIHWIWGVKLFLFKIRTRIWSS